jgi:hypothetical protein
MTRSEFLADVSMVSRVYRMAWHSRELYLSAVAEMSAESRRAALTRGVGRPALRIVKGGVA